jgi:hypothetical protein
MPTDGLARQCVVVLACTIWPASAMHGDVRFIDRVESLGH